ncbi:MAG TPA: diaminopimelate epimerase [Gammaproteobacteria bacterium]|nr:diaminopimelate epimerase [Gammaproteobacteria bacterium]
MSTIKFSKMHGLGNDFVVIDGISQSVHLKKSMVKQWADRHVGIGFDQLLLILPSKKADFSCAIFNSDGTSAEQCGNGIRCAARFIYDKGLLRKKSMTIETAKDVLEALIEKDETIRVNMGMPRFEPSDVPFAASHLQHLYEIPLEEGQPGLALAVLSMGNPHAILQIEAIENFPVTKFGPLISTHQWFPEGVNVGFMEVVSSSHIRLRTFERGAGETLACGSNACAAVVSGINNHLLENKVKVELPLGNLWVSWEGEKNPVVLSGPAEYVFSGEI